MKVFLSWSGPKSRAVAETLKVWIPQIVQAVEPWMSADIDKGRRWGPEISVELEESSLGIICLTKDNLEAPWILFEAGALSKKNNDQVCTLLLGVNPADVEFPLGAFQHTSFEKEEIRRLVHTVNDAVRDCEKRAPTKETIDRLFEVLWPNLDQTISTILKTKSAPQKSARPSDEILQEILEILRLQERRAVQLERIPEAVPAQASSRDIDKAVGFIHGCIDHGITNQEEIAELVVDRGLAVPLLARALSAYALSEKAKNLNRDLKDKRTDTDKISIPSNQNILSLDTLLHYWPHIVTQIERKIGPLAASAISPAKPVKMDDNHIYLEFSNPSDFAKMSDVLKKGPFEQVVGECLDRKRGIRLVLADPK